MAKPLSLDEILARLDETESLRKQAIDHLLAERKLLDDKLAKLGYTDGAAKPKEVKKRVRRTKAELAASKSQGSEAHG
jgi:hypothetical protein